MGDNDAAGVSVDLLGQHFTKMIRLTQNTHPVKQKRQRAAALHDASRFSDARSNSDRSWSAAALCRFRASFDFQTFLFL
jgi:hypothetical protein